MVWMNSGEIAEVKITFETRIQGDLIVGFLLGKVFTMEDMCVLFLFLYNLIYCLVLN